MMSDSDDAIGYAAAADSYWQAGWRGVLPMERGSKKWPPSIKCPAARAKRPDHNQATCPDCVSYTGHTAVEPSYADIMAWCEQYRDGNLCLRTPDGVVGIDIDAYGYKTGAAALTEAIRRWGPLPPAPRTTSREDPVSGIRLFTVPPGSILEDRISFPELGIGDIELCQPHHRYVISWPSVHPEGRGYWWRNDNLQLIGIPRPDELNPLPQSWIDGLRVTRASNLDNTPVDVTITLTAGIPSLSVRERLSQAIKELNLPGQSRHDTACRHVMALMRMGKSGEPGVRQALDTLREVFVAARQVDKSGTPESARGEFERMITNDNVARELANPGVNDWIRNLVLEDEHRPEPNPLVAQRQPDANPQVDQRQDRVSPNSAESGDRAVNAPSGNEGRTMEPTRARSRLEEIEQGFWQSRESLAMVYQTAMSRMAAPWAVLGICAARALTQVRPNVTLPPVVGGPGSLNWFVAIVARSGGGKGAASGAANILIPKHTFKQRSIGSGEGLVKLFDRPLNSSPDQDTNEAILVNVDEVDTLTSISQRSGSTTIGILKSAFVGESLGFSYVNRANVKDVEDHGYRMTLVVSVQPRKSGGLFADEGGGFPQRFMWLPAGDKRITTDEIWPSGPLTLPPPSEWIYSRTISIPNEARILIKENRKKNAHEELDAIDGHALFCREKFAYALAVLDGRVEMTSEDWHLSGIGADVSDYTRKLCHDQLLEAAQAAAVERGQMRGIELESADVEKLQAQIKRGQRVLRWLLHKLDEAGPSGAAQGDLTERINSRDRKALSEIFTAGHEAVYSKLINGTIVWYRK